MPLIIEIPLDLEQRLAQAAQGIGWEPADLTIHLLDECLPLSGNEDATLPLFPTSPVFTADQLTTDVPME